MDKPIPLYALALLAFLSTSPARADAPKAAEATPPAAAAAAAPPAAAPPPAAEAAPTRADAPPTAADDHLIGADHVGPFALGASFKDVIDAALKAFKKSDVKLGDRDLKLPGLTLTFTTAGAKGILRLIEVTKAGLGSTKYLTAEGVGPGSSEKDVRLAFREAIKRAKTGKSDLLTPDSLPNVHFICSTGGVFSSASCKTVTLTMPKKRSGK